MIHAPLVSIIIPTFNRAHFIGETLDSVLGQTYTNWECIVVDDGSTDTTNELMQEYLRKDARFQYHHRPEEHLSGGNGARNYGFKLSKGEYIQWFDDDDVMLKDFLKVKVEAFLDDLYFVICTGYTVDSGLKNLKKKDLIIEDNLFKDYVLWKLKVYSPSVLFKRSYLTKQELFNEFLFRGQETEFFSRLFYKVPSKCFLIKNTPLFLYRQHNDSKSFQNKTYISKYNKSLAFNSIDNLYRGFELKEIDIIQFHYRLLVDYFLKGVDNKDRNNSFYILKRVSKLLFNENLCSGIKFFSIGLIVLIPLGRTKLANALKFKIL